MKNGIIFRLAAAGVLTVLGGCSPLPTYQPEAHERMVTATWIGMGTPHICKAGRNYKLEVAKTDGLPTTRIPVGERVVLWSFMHFQGYQISFSCKPSLSLVPAEGKDLLINSGLASGKCFIEAVRSDPSHPNGVTLEPSSALPFC